MTDLLKESNEEKCIHTSKDLGTRNTLLTNTKKKLQVILVYPGEEIPYSHIIMLLGLSQIGVSAEIYSLFSDIDKIYERMKEKKAFQIRGIGTYYETIPQTIRLAKQIKRSNPDRRIVTIGGSGVNDLMTRNMLIGSTHAVEVINYGHCSPFIEWIEKIKDFRSFSVEKLQKIAGASGLIIEEDMEVPMGKFPHLDFFPLQFGEPLDNDAPGVHLSIPHYFNCPNACDYCAQINFSAPYMLDDMIKSIRSFPETIREVQFEGPTFEGQLIPSFRKILQVIQEKQGYMPTTHIVMDSKQFQQDKRQTTQQLLKEFNTTSVHIGINSIDEVTGKMVGRKNNGKIRTQKQLDEEVSGVIQFLQSSDIKEVKLDMLLTPLDTKETIQRILDFFAKTLQAAKDFNKTLDIYFAPLIPYPGTKVFQRVQPYIKDFRYDKLYSTIFFDPTLWNEEFGLFGVEFLRRFNAPFLASRNNLFFTEDRFRNEYLQYLALSMTYQYLQGKQTLEEMDHLFPEYKNDKAVEAIFYSLVTQSVPLSRMHLPSAEDTETSQT